MLKTIENIRTIVKPKKTKTEVYGDNMVCGNKVTNQINFIKGKNQAKTTKSKNLVKSKNHNFPPNSINIEARLDFLILVARFAFIKLRQVCVKTLIFYYFDLKYHI